MNAVFRSYPLKTKVAFVLLGLLCLLYLLIEAQGEGDFHIYISASRDLFAGKNIFETTYGNGFHYLYSVLFAILLYPLSFLPFYLAKFFWLLLNAFLLYRTFAILFSYFNLKTWSKPQQTAVYAASLIFSLRFIHENFHTGQITILILYTCVQGLCWIFYTDKWLWGCLLIATGINIKLMPVVLVPYLLYRAKFKEAATVIFIDIALWLLPALVIGWQRNSFLVSEWWLRMNPANEGHVLDVSERSFHSLTTLLSTLLVEHVPDTYAMPLKRNIADVSLHTLSLVILCSRALLAGFALYFLRSMPFKPATGKGHQFAETAYLLAVVPLIFPHQQHYAFLFIVPAAMYVIAFFIRNKAMLRRGQKIFLWASGIFIYLCCNLKLILGEYNHYYEHYKILTYVALWLLVVLAYSTSGKKLYFLNQ